MSPMVGGADQEGTEDGSANASDDKGVTARYLLPDLPDHITEEHIQNYFSVLGEIEEITVKQLSAGGGSRLGSVKFRNPTLDLRNVMLREAHEIEGSPVTVMTWKMQKLQKPGYQAKMAAEAAAKAGGKGGGMIVGAGRGIRPMAAAGMGAGGCEGKGWGNNAQWYQGGDPGWGGKGCQADWGKGAWGDYGYSSAASSKSSGKFGCAKGYGPAYEAQAKGGCRSGPYGYPQAGMGGQAWQGPGDYGGCGGYGPYGGKGGACGGQWMGPGAYGGKPGGPYGGGKGDAFFGGWGDDGSGWGGGGCYGGKGPMNGGCCGGWGKGGCQGGSSIVGAGKGAGKVQGKKGAEELDVTARYLLSQLPEGITEEALQEYFGTFGEIEEVVVKHVPSQGMQGSVKFSSPTMELRRIMLKETHIIEGQQVLVETWKMRKLARPSAVMGKAAEFSWGTNGYGANGYGA